MTTEEQAGILTEVETKFQTLVFMLNNIELTENNFEAIKEFLGRY